MSLTDFSFWFMRTFPFSLHEKCSLLGMATASEVEEMAHLVSAYSVAQFKYRCS